jgi:hypothetical protein
MNDTLDNKDYLNLADTAFGHPFHFLWSDICSLVEKPKYKDFSSFENRRDLFLSVLKRLLDEKKVSVGKEEKIISNNTADIIEMFKKSFPKDDNEMENGIWFLTFPDKCPGGAVWLVDEDLAPLYCTPTGDGKFYYWT